MARTRTRPSSKPLERLLPVSYLAVALGLAALLLPTILRPPQDLQNTTAAFSPDAPPEETPPEAILQSLRQASSSTAGGAPPPVVEQEEVVIEEIVEEQAPPPPKRQAVKAGCFGDPPRQTESLYSALCVPAWTGGDNGGATAQGVTGDTINIAIGVETSTTVEEGPLAREFAAEDQATERTLKVWQTYFNDRFVFSGRYLQFHVYKVDSTDEEQARAKVREAATQGMFAYIGHYATTNAAATAEAIKQQMVTFAFDYNPAPFYKDNHPYVYSFEMDSLKLSALGSEYACKQFTESPVQWKNERMDLSPSFNYGGPRKFGLIIYQDEIRTGSRAQSERNAAKCGIKYEEVVEYNLNDDASKIAGAVTKMRQAGVTTIVVGVDPLTPAVLGYEAERTQYYPEWYCAAGCDTNGTARLLPDNQANHMISFSPAEIPRADADKDWYRAYKEMDPEGDPEFDYFRDLQQLSGGIQGAGPELTPESFWKGLKAVPCRAPDPIWSIGGCYRDPDPTSDVQILGDYTYSDYVSFMWYDNAADDPASTSAGAWCYMNMGARYKSGEIPTEPFPFRDPDKCIFTPPRGEQG